MEEHSNLNMGNGGGRGEGGENTSGSAANRGAADREEVNNNNGLRRSNRQRPPTIVIGDSSSFSSSSSSSSSFSSDKNDYGRNDPDDNEAMTDADTDQKKAAPTRRKKRDSIVRDVFEEPEIVPHKKRKSVVIDGSSQADDDDAATSSSSSPRQDKRRKVSPTAAIPEEEDQKHNKAHNTTLRATSSTHKCSLSSSTSSFADFPSVWWAYERKNGRGNNKCLLDGSTNVVASPSSSSSSVTSGGGSSSIKPRATTASVVTSIASSPSSSSAAAAAATIHQTAALLSDRACKLWSSPLGAKYASQKYRPAGVYRRLGVINLEFEMYGPSLTTELQVRKMIGDGHLHSSMKKLLSPPSGGSTAATYFTTTAKPPTKYQVKKDAIHFFDQHPSVKNPLKKTNKQNQKLDRFVDTLLQDWTDVVKAGPIERPTWHPTTGQVLSEQPPSSTTSPTPLPSDAATSNVMMKKNSSKSKMKPSGTPTSTSTIGKNTAPSSMSRPPAPPSCTKLLRLLKAKMLQDTSPQKTKTLYNGLRTINIGAEAVLTALCDLAVPSKDLYDMPLLLSVPKIHDIDISLSKPSNNINLSSSSAATSSSGANAGTSTSNRSAKIRITIGCYAHRLLFEVMTQHLQTVLAAMDQNSYDVSQPLTPPPCIPRPLGDCGSTAAAAAAASSSSVEPVFDSDPDGPQVVFDMHDYSDDEDSSDEDEDSDDKPKSQKKEFDHSAAFDGKLDVYTPQGYLKWIENHGVCMRNWNVVEGLLRGKLDIELMLHQKHGVTFMYEQEQLSNGINSLIWEQRSFPEGDKYYYSPALGQLRLTLKSLPNTTKAPSSTFLTTTNPVRGGILSDEMGLGKTAQVVSLVVATLPEVKEEMSKRKTSSSATLIVVPPALINQWCDEVKKISSKLVVDFFDHKTDKFVRRTDNAPEDGSVNPDIVLTTYQAVGSKSFQILGSTYWARVVLDEMQEIRSNTTSIAKNCNALAADRRWMLSGTPLFEGINDFRGELCFLQLAPFAADNEDGFFNFAVANHWDQRSPYGLETLRILSLIMLRRSKSMIVRKTGLPLLGLKPMTVTYQPVSQSTSERALYCFLEHLMHSVVTSNSLGRNSKKKKRNDQRSFVRILGELCVSTHLLNGSVSCQPQLDILNRWMKVYNKHAQFGRNNAGNIRNHVYSCEEAIQFISQADSNTRKETDFVSDLRMGAGGGAAKRNRAMNMGSRTEEELRELHTKVGEYKTFRAEKQSMRAKKRWHWALESITTGKMSCYKAVENVCIRMKWENRRSATKEPCGWRPSSQFISRKALLNLSDICGCLSMLYQHNRKFHWAHPRVALLSDIPNSVKIDEVEHSIVRCIQRRKTKIETTGSQVVQLISFGPKFGDGCWNSLCQFEKKDDYDFFFKVATQSNGFEIKTKAAIPHIVERISRTKTSCDQAEARAITHPSLENEAKKKAAEKEWKEARAGLRAVCHFKAGHVRVSRSFVAFRAKSDEGLYTNLGKDIASMNEYLDETRKTIEGIEKRMFLLETEETSALQGEVKVTTAVDALESLKKGDVDETQCPFCMDTLGSSDEEKGMVVATSCGHLACLPCFEQYKKSKTENSQPFNCAECRKPIAEYIRVNPKKEDLSSKKRSEAKSLIQEAAKLLKSKECGRLDPEIWEALYYSIDLPTSNFPKRGRFTAIPGDILCHLHHATGLPVDSRSLEEGAIVSSKIQALLHDLPKDEISVVFASSNSIVKHLMRVLEIHNIGCRGLFNGQTEAASKDAIEEWHNDSSVLVLVVQAGAAACGLTLTASSRMFLLSPFLKYEEEQQAYARLHRYGQRKEVHCTVYYTPVSIESRLLEWRKQYSQFAPSDEKMEYATLQGTNPDGNDEDVPMNDDRSDVEEILASDDDDDDEENIDGEDENEQEENQTRFLLNLQS